MEWGVEWGVEWEGGRLGREEVCEKKGGNVKEWLWWE